MSMTTLHRSVLNGMTSTNLKNALTDGVSFFTELWCPLTLWNLKILYVFIWHGVPFAQISPLLKPESLLFVRKTSVKVS